MHHTLSVSIILWLISPVLGNTLRYIILALILAAFTAYAVNLFSPSRRLIRLEDAIKTVEDILARAMESCSRDYLELMDLADCLIHVEISASKIRIQLLNASSLEKWSLKIMERINECTKKVEEINTSVLRIMEGEHQYQLNKSSREKREVIDAIILPPTRMQERVRRRLALQESDIV
ncbi:hypothetical protein C8F04DRAFT_1075667 [Mycena alexandri]|uniref:ATP synthase protein MI25 n=1 Tax=Mycena alexandri TaxID=1745969 RepID=A0AAD6XF50_9AGAR|nr:hypothetical protein C8F04DRAFT_1075667 [Mycena alexandri]